MEPRFMYMKQVAQLPQRDHASP